MIPLNSMVALWTAMVPLAEEIPDPNDVKPGWVGFTVVVVLMVAVVLLWLSFRKQLKKVNFEEPSENGETGTAEALERDRQAARLRRALLLLREDQRELIVLARYRDMKYEAIADLLGVEVGTIKTRMHRAVNELRKIFLGLSENQSCSVKQPENGLSLV